MASSLPAPPPIILLAKRTHETYTYSVLPDPKDTMLVIRPNAPRGGAPNFIMAKAPFTSDALADHIRTWREPHTSEQFSGILRALVEPTEACVLLVYCAHTCVDEAYTVMAMALIEETAAVLRVRNCIESPWIKLTGQKSVLPILVQQVLVLVHNWYPEARCVEASASSTVPAKVWLDAGFVVVAERGEGVDYVLWRDVLD